MRKWVYLIQKKKKKTRLHDTWYTSELCGHVFEVSPLNDILIFQLLRSKLRLSDLLGLLSVFLGKNGKKREREKKERYGGFQETDFNDEP